MKPLSDTKSNPIRYPHIHSKASPLTSAISFDEIRDSEWKLSMNLFHINKAKEVRTWTILNHFLLLCCDYIFDSRMLRLRIARHSNCVNFKQAALRVVLKPENISSEYEAHKQNKYPFASFVCMLQVRFLLSLFFKHWS